MSTIKRSIQAALANYTFINRAFYKAVTKTETKAFLDAIAEIQAIDSIEDPFALLELKKREELGERLYTRDRNVANAFIYGIWQSVFPFLNPLDPAAYPSVEHGLILGDAPYEDSLLTGRSCLVTFGQHRKNILRKALNRPVFCVGPYIQYASEYYSAEKKKDLKASLGKTLLVFPRHSTDTGKISYQEKQLLKEISALREGYKTVLICMFWRDLDRPIVNELISEGYQIVSAGYRDDPRFLSRLKTIINLSDFAVSDGMGTHIGYCASEGVPVIILNSSSEIVNSEKWAMDNAVSAHVNESLIISAFDGTMVGQRSQAEILKEYWGFGISRSLEERQAIASISKRLADDTNGRMSRVGEVSLRTLKELEKAGSESEFQMLNEAMDSAGTNL